MARKITAAAVQLSAHDRRDFPRAWPAARDAVESALHQGARLVVLPEATAPGYVMGYEPYGGDETERALADLSLLAQRHHAVVVAGVVRVRDGLLENSAVVVDTDGTIAGEAAKRFLWHFDRQWFRAGDAAQPVKTALGTIGAFVCADGRIPTIARQLVDDGAEVLAMPTAWVTSGRDPFALENVQADLLARVRARENGVPFVAANKCGAEASLALYCGKSQIVDADGTIVAIADQHVAHAIFASIELSPQRAQRVPAGRVDEPQSFLRPRRIAITPDVADSALEAQLRILGADAAIGPAFAREEMREASPLRVDDATVFDPAGLAGARLRGHLLAVWETDRNDGWQVTFARARALELRMYVVVIDTNATRAYAVDPDGVVLCGTMDGYRLASFAFEPARAAATTVAPGTDVLDGLRAAAPIS